MRGLCHIEINVPNYEQTLPFYDRMFGWLGFKSFSTLGIDYTSTYYVALPHSYIGIQPAAHNERVVPEERHVGVNHVALWAANRKQVDRFYREFLVPERVRVTDVPAYYPDYAPTYYAVFFLDPTGIRWELAYMPFLVSPRAIWRWWKRGSAFRHDHPEWKRHPFFEAQRTLPRGRHGSGTAGNTGTSNMF